MQMKSPYKCKFCTNSINFVNRVALNPDGSRHLCRNASQDTEEVDFRDEIAKLVLKSELQKLNAGEGIAPETTTYCYEVAEWMLSARNNLDPRH